MVPVQLMSSGGSGSITAGLESAQTVVTYIIGQMGTMVTTIASQPLLLLPTGFFIAGGCIGLAKRLMR